MAELQQDLPAGWSSQVDPMTGKLYFINHYTKMTTWEDPRPRSRQLHGTNKHLTSVQSEYIPLQHGSPDLRRNYIYPSQTSPIPAFQMPGRMSPLSPRISLQDMKPRMSPLTVKSSKVQDSSLTNITDTDDAVAVISGMFPTVSETHIRLLLKKYHNREALVISALQVEKYPITTPGPSATPPPQRPAMGAASASNSVYTGSPRIGDGFRSSPKPPLSPKLKLRYMKSIFPDVDETVILEVLLNNENNIQKGSEILTNMGYTKKNTVKEAQQKMEAKKEEKKKVKEEKEKLANPPVPEIKIKTKDEKNKMKAELQEKYKDVAEHLIDIALESVNYNESRANQILQIMIQEDTEVNNKKEEEKENVVEDPTSVPSTSTANLPVSQSRQSLKSLLKEKPEKEKEKSYSRVITGNDTTDGYSSKNLISTNGPNPINVQGTDEKLLLEDYVRWQGPNPSLRRGPQGLAKGPNVTFFSRRSYQPCGPNANLRKGPKFGLAKGSIFSQLKTVIVGESHGE